MVVVRVVPRIEGREGQKGGLYSNVQYLVAGIMCRTYLRGILLNTVRRLWLL